MTIENSCALRVLIADDEPVAVTGLSQILAKRSEIHVVGTAGCGRETLKQIKNLRPQVVLLDIQMPDMTGFDVVSQLPGGIVPSIIFVTAHRQFALRAFEVHAVNYILKPVDEQHLFTTLERIQAHLRGGPLPGQGNEFNANRTMVSVGNETLVNRKGTLSIKSRGGVIFVPIDRVTYIESAGNYVRYFVDEECYLARSTLHEVERQLETSTMKRVHRSRMVNVVRIRCVRPHPSGEYLIEFDNGQSVTTGRSFRQQVRNIVRSQRQSTVRIEGDLQ